jgi:serine protease AprX
MKKNTKAREVLESWAEANGFKIPVLAQELARSQPGLKSRLNNDIFDALTEDEMSHISRPQNLDDLHAKGITGKGVTVAVIDSGIAPHSDFGDRIVAFRDFTSGRTVKKSHLDTTGHGTHVAGIIAGDGEITKGIAPEANLVGCRIHSEHEAIKAIDWVIANREKYSIDIVNLSLGVDAPKNPAEDEFRKAAERAVDAGLIVVAAAGNECTDSHCSATISSPGISPKVITVGALDDKGTAKPGDDRVYSASSRGKEHGGKPDLVAEGVNVLAPLAHGSTFASHLAASARYVALAGSSQAAPMVAGTVALMLQVNPDLTHEEAKTILKRTADKLENVSASAQGAGRIDVKGAVASAKRRL